MIERARGGVQLSAQEPVAKCAQGVQIGALVEHGAVERLWRDEGRSASYVRRNAIGHHGAKIEELAATRLGLAHVARADVAVNEALGVEKCERRCDIAQVQTRVGNAGDTTLTQVGAAEQLHRVVRATLVEAVVVHRHDERVAKPCKCVVFSLEQGACAACRVQQALERHVSPSRGLTDVKDLSHASLGQARYDFVTPCHQGLRHRALIDGCRHRFR